MKHLFLAILLGAFSLRAVATVALPPALAFAPLPDPAAVLNRAAAITTNRFPDADAVLVDDLVREAYQPDGTSVSIDDEYTKILTEKGRRDASVRSFFFMAAYGTVTVARAEVIKPDGRRIAIDTERNGRVMIESGQMGANIYDPNLKLFQLSVPGLEIGDICHFAALHTVWKAQVPNTWSDLNLFEAEEPIQHFTYEISAPESLPLLHIHLRAAITGTVAATTSPLPGQRLLHHWEIHDVPQMFPEPAMPGQETVVQRLVLSTAPDWPTLSRWYWNLCQPRLAAISPDMRATVSNLVAGAESREARIARLFTFVSQNVRYMGITAETISPGYEPHDVAMTFSNRYGVCRDKAALLVAMLRLAGFDAYPVLINVGSKMDAEAPLPWFNHAIVAIANPDGGYQLMDPTNEHTHDLFPAYLGNRSYLVAHPAGEGLRVSDVTPAERQLVHVATRGTLDDAGTLALDVHIAFDGINDTFYRGSFLRQKPDERRRFFEGLLKARLAGAEITAFRLTPDNLSDTTEPLAVALSCRVRDYPVAGDGVTLLAMPWLGPSLGYVNRLLGDMGLRQRRFPYVTELACGVDETVTLDLGRSIGAPLHLPADTRINRDGLAFQMSVAVSNGTCAAHLRQLLQQPEFSPAEYAGVKASLRDVEYATRQRPAFTPAAAAQADVRILSDAVRIDLESPQAWTSTRTIVRQILTYSGKKRTSELKMPFNPIWQTAELVSATVSNLDGSVHTVTPREINEMDAPWVGGAARYPAGKLRVISLPGVEIGSVIRTVVRRTQRDAPFFALEQPFGGFDPVTACSLEIAAPRDLNLRVETCHDVLLHATCVTNAATIVRRWEAGLLPAVKPEDSLPAWRMFCPTVLLSAGDWRAYARTLDHAFAQVMRRQPGACERARALVRGLHDETARLRAIRDDVARAVRIDGPGFLDLPLACLTPADRTLADGYGHAADRALLLATMLRAAGFEADPIPVADARHALDDDFGPLWRTAQPILFGDVLVQVKMDHDRVVYLGDDDQYAEPGSSPHEGHPLLDADGRTRRVSVAADDADREESDWTIDLDRRGTARITIESRVFGSACAGFRKQFAEMPPEERSRYFQGIVAGVSQSARPIGDLVTDLTSYPSRCVFTVEAERYAVVEGNMLILLLAEAGVSPIPLRADQRTSPLFIDHPERSTWTCRVILPLGVQQVPVLPPNLDWTLPNGLGRIRLTVQQAQTSDGRLMVLLRRSTTLEPALVPAEVYPALTEINRRLTHPQMSTLLATFGAAPAP